MKKNFTTVFMLFILCSTSLVAQVKLNNQVIVYFKSGVQRNAPNYTTASINSSNVLSILNTYGIPASNVVPSFPTFNEADTVLQSNGKVNNGLTGEESRQMNRAKVFTITVTNLSTKQSFINSLKSLSEVLYAETNGELTTNLIPADGRFNQQWGLRNLTVPNADIHAVPAWDIFTGNPNAIIAIIDDGVDRAHNDLAAKLTGGDNGFITSVDRFDPAIRWSHGTHVSGIAAAVTNNAGNNGVAGVDWQAQIHPKNIFDGSGDPDITQSIIDAVNFNANVWTFNNSWGLTNGNDGNGNGIPGRYSTTVRSAFAQAYRNNRVQCVAMGNHQAYSGGVYANVVAYPAGFNSGIIAVGATDDHDNIGNFSAQGTHIDVSAPGVNILSTNFGNNYINLSGTSQATPYVAGLASLLKGFNTNLANDDIEQIVRLTADDRGTVGFDNVFGAGRVNALRALQSLQAPNTLQQLNTTGGTIFSTSGSITKIFLGVPGLADAAYIVKRSEVRKAIALPAMCNTIGVWGRGVGTTGYREELGTCYGEGICEVVSGTLTANSCTLRTYIYEVWSASGQYLGFYPRAANNVVFQYTILGAPTPSSILGDNIFCTTSTNYTIPNLPAGATVTWSVTPSGIATPNSPNAPQTTLTKNADGVITLTATISNACGQTITAAKPNIRVGTYTHSDYTIYSWPSTICYGQTVQFGPLAGQVPDATSYNWIYPSGNWTYISGQGTRVITLKTPIYTPYTTSGDVGLSVGNACGVSSFFPLTNFPYFNCSGYSPYVISPNPSSDLLKIEPNNASVLKSLATTASEVQEVDLIDKMGIIRYKNKFGKGLTTTTISVSNLPNDIYTLRIFDGKTWYSHKLIIQH